MISWGDLPSTSLAKQSGTMASTFICVIFGVGSLDFFLEGGSSEPSCARPGLLRAHLATTALLFTFFMDTVESARLVAKAALAKDFLAKVSHLVCQEHRSAGKHSTIGVSHAGHLALDPAGVVSGLEQVLISMHRTVAGSLKDEWHHMKNDGLLFSEWAHPTLLDLVSFVSSLPRFRKDSGRKPLKSSVLERLKIALVSFLAHSLHDHIWNRYRHVHDIYNSQIPSRRKFFKKRWGLKTITNLICHLLICFTYLCDMQVFQVFWHCARKCSSDDSPGASEGNGACSSSSSSVSRMTLPQIWKFIEEAQQKSMSLCRLAKVRKSDASAGSSEGAVGVWQSKMIHLYNSRAVLAFQFFNHFCIVTDSSCHGCKDTLISVFYSPLNDNCAFATCQWMKPGKVISPLELSLEEHVEYLAARREVERLHAYRFMQALSQQVEQMSGGKFTLSSFKPPLAMCLEPLCPGDSFCISSGRLAVTRKRRDRQVESVQQVIQDLSGVDEMPVISLVMDQGPTGMAAMAYLHSLGVLVHSSFDKVHRCVRDLKLAATHASGNFKESTAMTSFAWSLNYKPFKSGAWYEEKKAALGSFLATETSVIWILHNNMFFVFDCFQICFQFLLVFYLLFIGQDPCLP